MRTPSSALGRDHPVLKLSRPADLLTAIPYLLGFQPARSLVALGLHGPRHRLVFTMRMDLDGPSEEQIVTEAVTRLVQAGSDQALLVVYDPDPADGSAGLGGRSLVAAIAARLDSDRTGVFVRDALCVVAGRWWSYTCNDPQCCPPEGTPMLSPTEVASGPVAAVATYAGLATLPDRDALVASLAGPVFLLREAMEQATERAVWESTARRVTSPQSLATWRTDVLAEFTALVERYAEPPGEVDNDTAARLIVALHDIEVRDLVASWGAGPQAAALLALLGDLVRRAVPSVDAPVVTVLGSVAYQSGEGAVAGIAFERALRSDPAYRLALLLETLLRNGVHPREIRRISRQAGADLGGGNGRRGGRSRRG